MTTSIRTLDQPGYLEAHLQGTFDEEAVQEFDELLSSKIEGPGVRLLLRLEDFDGWETLEATWDSLRLLRHHRDHVERIATIADKTWKGVAVTLAGSFSGAETRVFEPDEAGKARVWLHADEA